VSDRTFYTKAALAEALSCTVRQVDRYMSPKYCEEHGIPLLVRSTLGTRVGVSGEDFEEWKSVAIRRAS